MSNHWESSARPLSVRTVFVNGHRHAILFEEDPLLHYGNPNLKKISRSNSSLSSASDHSLTSSESQDSNLDDRVPKPRNSGQRQRKDLSSELQSCLIKFQLASANLENGIKPAEEKCICHSKEPERSPKEISKQRKLKCKRDKTCRRKQHCEYPQGEPKENRLIGKGVDKNSGCYFYNYDSSQRKKNYCVVKISSQPPKFTLSCRCDSSDAHKCKALASGKNKMVISATIHNLFMTTRKDRLFDHKVDKSFFGESIDSIDLYWNSYLTRSYYNSLSERVFQWLDLASKRKNQKQKPNPPQGEDASNCTERIFSGKTFVGESKRTEYFDESMSKQPDEATMKKTENGEEESSKEEVETGVLGEVNIESYFCGEKLQDGSQERFEKETTAIPLTSAAGSQEERTAAISAAEETQSNSPEVNLKSCTIPTETPLKIQDLLLGTNLRRNFNFPFGERNAPNIRGTRERSSFRNKRRQIKELVSTEEEEEEEEQGQEDDENAITMPFKYWEKKTVRKPHQFDMGGKHTPCHCSRTFDECADNVNHELTERLPERNQKSINNPSITRTQPVLIQSVLPAQHYSEISSSRAEKAVWGSEKPQQDLRTQDKSTKRPQLHIFMPSLLLKDASDDSLSECENVLNTC